MTDTLGRASDEKQSTESADAIRAMAGDLKVLPPQAELRRPNVVDTMASIHAEAIADTPESVVPEIGAAERALSRPNVDLLEGANRQITSVAERQLISDVREKLSGARSLQELKDKAEVLAGQGLVAQEATFNVDEGIMRRETTLTEIETDKDGEVVEGWFKPIPGDRMSQLVMDELERAKQDLDRRSKIQSARDRLNLKKEDWEDGRTAKRESKDIERQKEVSEAAENSRETDRMNAEAEAWVTEARTLDDYMAEKITEARRPFEAEIAKLRRDKQGLSKLTSILVNKETESKRINQKIGEQQMLMIQQENKIRLDIRAEIPRLGEEVTLETSKVRDLLDGASDGKTSYEPASDRDPDSVVAISRSISDTVGRHDEPINTDEYKLGDTIMQRLVYKTDNESVVVVEDWDKTAGILKRQVVMKGRDVLVPDYQNEGVSERKVSKLQKKGQFKLELSTKAHEEIGLIKQEQVVGDSGTSYDAGSFAFAGRLKRSGVSAGSSYKMASGTYKPEESKGFIAMLRENLTKKSS